MKNLLPPPKQPLRVALVDPERRFVQELSQTLRERDHEVVFVHLIGELAAKHVDVIFFAPPGNDIEDLERYKARGNRTPSVVALRDKHFESAQAACRIGVSALCVDPVSPSYAVDLIESVARRVDRYETTYSSSPFSTQEAARDLAAFLVQRGVGPSHRVRVASALSEIVDNAWRHGYAQEDGRPIRVGIEMHDRSTIEIVVRDWGTSFFDEFHASGGLARARELCEMLEVSPLATGIRITLEFRLYPVLFGDDPLDFTEIDYLVPESARRLLGALRFDMSADTLQVPPTLAVTTGRLLAVPDVEPVRPLP